MESKNVGIWIRVSTEMQVESESPEHHEQRARYYAASRGWQVIEVYRLEAVSGKSVMNHMETQRMLRDIREKKITGLIFSKLARVARNTKELLEFSEIFRRDEADLISLSENIDTSTPAGRLFYTMIAAMAAWEREEISERVAASVPVRVRLGKRVGGNGSFGYRWVKNNFVIDEKEGPIRKLLYELFLKYKRKKTTARELNKMGYRTRNGSLFCATSVERLLRDPSAKGMRRANYTKSRGEKKHWDYKEEKDWIHMPCPSLVSEELWNQCNAILNEQKEKRKAPGPRSVHLLAGFVKCTCGNKMYAYHEKKPIYACRPCKRRILADDLHSIYHEQLKNFLLTESDLQHYLEQSDAHLQEKVELLRSTRQEADRVNQKIIEYIELRVKKEYTPERFKEVYGPLEERYQQLKKMVPELEAEIDFLKIHHLSSETVLEEAKSLYNQWPDLPFEEKRNIVETITESIIIDVDEIGINLSYFPEPLSAMDGKKNRLNKGSSKRLT